MRGAGGAAALPKFVIPPAAVGPWRALCTALAERGPAPCEAGLLRADAWFSNAEATVELAKLACRLCPAQRECRAYAIAAGERHGLWAGTTPEERR